MIVLISFRNAILQLSYIEMANRHRRRLCFCLSNNVADDEYTFCSRIAAIVGSFLGEDRSFAAPHDKKNDVKTQMTQTEEQPPNVVLSPTRFTISTPTGFSDEMTSIFKGLCHGSEDDDNQSNNDSSSSSSEIEYVNVHY